jgi:hypothetical protein
MQIVRDQQRWGLEAVPEQAPLLKYLRSEQYGFSLTTWEHLVASVGGSVRHPLMDLDLVEFSLGVGESRLSTPGKSKGVLRAAMVGILPETVRRREGKAYFERIITRDYPFLLATGSWGDWILVQRAILDPSALDSMWRSAYLRYESEPFASWLYSCELFARAVTSGASCG